MTLEKKDRFFALSATPEKEARSAFQKISFSFSFSDSRKGGQISTFESSKKGERARRCKRKPDFFALSETPEKEARSPFQKISFSGKQGKRACRRKRKLATLTLCCSLSKRTNILYVTYYIYLKKEQYV